jgi:hypothetical protein
VVPVSFGHTKDGSFDALLVDVKGYDPAIARAHLQDQLLHVSRSARQKVMKGLRRSATFKHLP